MKRERYEMEEKKDAQEKKGINLATLIFLSVIILFTIAIVFGVVLRENNINSESIYKDKVSNTENRNQIRLLIVFVAISVCIASIIISLAFVVKTKSAEPDSWVLHSYGNNVALYNGDKIVEVFGSIVLDTLPSEDKRLLDNGIAFQTKEEAVSAIEDYDG